MSELRRTQQTARYINRYHNLPVTIDSRLNDNKTGFEGKPVAEYYAALKASADRWTVRLHEGESLEDVRGRVSNFLEELKAQPFDAVLVVTSMSIVQALCGLIEGLTMQQAWNLEVDKGSCLELEV